MRADWSVHATFLTKTQLYFGILFKNSAIGQIEIFVGLRQNIFITRY